VEGAGGGGRRVRWRRAGGRRPAGSLEPGGGRAAAGVVARAWRKAGERRPTGSLDEGGSTAMFQPLEQSSSAGSGSWAPGVACCFDGRSGMSALLDGQT
jgi:hypothetical protein